MNYTKVDEKEYEGIKDYCFKFEVEDAWYNPKHTVTIMNTGIVFLYHFEKGLFKTEIPADLVQEVFERVNNDCFYDTDFRLEQLDGIVLDGLIHEIEFKVTNRECLFHIPHLDAYGEYVYDSMSFAETYPHISILINLIDDIKELLSDYVEEWYFQLDY